MPIKLEKVRKELNISINAAVEFARSIGYDIHHDLNERIDDELYLALAKHFRQDVARALEAPAAPKSPVLVPTAQDSTVVRIPAPPLKQPKIMGKIDLSNIPQSSSVSDGMRDKKRAAAAERLRNDYEKRRQRNELAEQIGRTIRWNDDRGFGFVRSNGKEYFMHISSCLDQKAYYAENMFVFFTPDYDAERKRERAHFVRFPQEGDNCIDLLRVACEEDNRSINFVSSGFRACAETQWMSAGNTEDKVKADLQMLLTGDIDEAYTPTLYSKLMRLLGGDNDNPFYSEAKLNAVRSAFCKAAIDGGSKSARCALVILHQIPAEFKLELFLKAEPSDYASRWVSTYPRLDASLLDYIREHFPSEESARLREAYIDVYLRNGDFNDVFDCFERELIPEVPDSFFVSKAQALTLRQLERLQELHKCTYDIVQKLIDGVAASERFSSKIKLTQLVGFIEERFSEAERRQLEEHIMQLSDDDSYTLFRQIGAALLPEPVWKEKLFAHLCREIDENIVNHHGRGVCTSPTWGLINRSLSEACVLELSSRVSLLYDNRPERFALWECGIITVAPMDIIEQRMLSGDISWRKVHNWHQEERIDDAQFQKLQQVFVAQYEHISDRNKFIELERLIKQGGSHALREIFANNKYAKAIIWYEVIESGDTTVELPRKEVLELFPFFSADEQTVILKYLFLLKAKELLDFSPADLLQLTQTPEGAVTEGELAPKMDLATDLIIHVMAHYAEHGVFMKTTDLFKRALECKPVLQDETEHPLKRFAAYLDACNGLVNHYRQHVEADGDARIIHFGAGRFYYAVELKVTEEVTVNGRYGPFTQTVKRGGFEELKQELKKTFPSARWNPEAMHWGIPDGVDEASVSEFCRNHRITMEWHPDFKPFRWASFRNPQPFGVRFCEGRKQSQPGDDGKERCWCCTGFCYEPVLTPHDADHWKYYTLYDFCRSFGFSLDSDSNKTPSKQAINGEYLKFVGTVNQFYLMFNHLFCRHCDKLMLPVILTKDGAHATTSFCCVNNECEGRNKTVYLNHCLNGKCKNIIDSRDVAACPNGRYVCNHCGCCCSTLNVEQRMENGADMTLSRLRFVEDKLGHLERAQHFCYCCGQEMKETGPETFECINQDCDRHPKYELEGYRLDRRYRHLR